MVVPAFNPSTGAGGSLRVLGQLGLQSKFTACNQGYTEILGVCVGVDLPLTQHAGGSRFDSQNSYLYRACLDKSQDHLEDKRSEGKCVRKVCKGTRMMWLEET